MGLEEKLMKVPRLLVPGGNLVESYLRWRAGEKPAFDEAVQWDVTKAVLYTAATLLILYHHN